MGPVLPELDLQILLVVTKLLEEADLLLHWVVAVHSQAVEDTFLARLVEDTQVTSLVVDSMAGQQLAIPLASMAASALVAFEDCMVGNLAIGITQVFLRSFRTLDLVAHLVVAFEEGPF